MMLTADNYRFGIKFSAVWILRSCEEKQSSMLARGAKDHLPGAEKALSQENGGYCRI